ncbi:hypothetical protein GY45DRAFT_1125987 [Cubamyces sp. BRFM 1775]|nr:hypothetical protein GY45DRAFT_1125987 [Cubamyces sp. BRFM 1775]
MDQSAQVQSEESYEGGRGKVFELPSPNAGVCHLPPEVVNIIFEHASSDKTVISACSLVSSSWRALSLSHLFSSLTVARQNTFDDFGDFLDAHSDISYTVRILVLQHLPGGPGLFMTIAPLVALAAKLPRLQVLHLARIWLAVDLPLPSSFPPTAPPRRLEKLIVNNCTSGDNRWFSPRTIYGILATFPADAVSLYLLTVGADIPSQIVPPGTSSKLYPPHEATRVRIHSLTLDRNNASAFPMHDMAPLHEGLRLTLAPLCLHTFRSRSGLDRRNPESLRVFGELMSQIGGETLRHLEFPFIIGQVVYPSEDEPDHWRALRLHTCRNLETVVFSISVPLLQTLTIPRRAQEPPRVPVCAVLVAFLPHLPLTLRTCKLVLSNVGLPARIQSRRTMDLERLDAALRDRLPSLTKIQIVLQGRKPFEVEQCVQTVQELMPVCRNNGLLHVTVEKEETMLGL